MNNNLKVILQSIIGCFIYYVAFVKNVFGFEILSWILLGTAFLGLFFKQVTKELAASCNKQTYLISTPGFLFSLWVFFAHSAQTFGYFYVLFVLISQTLILNEKLKTRL